ACQGIRSMPKSGSMKSLAARTIAALVFIVLANFNALGQTFASTPKTAPTQTVDLQALAKKIDEQNAKIDALSQQILKLQQSIANQRPGVMIGEGAPSTSTPTSAASTSTAVATE